MAFHGSAQSLELAKRRQCAPLSASFLSHTL
jgi:hypothetical protein